MEQQGHGTGEKMSLMQKIKKKLHVGHAHGADQHTDVDDGQQGHAVVAAPVTEGHAVTGTDGTPANSATYGQQAHSGVTGEKKDVMEDNKEKLPGGHNGDHEQTSGTDVHRGHIGTAMHGTPATDDAYGQQGHTGETGMGTHGTGDKNGVMENIKDKLPGGHGEHQQTGAHYGQQGHAVVAAPVTEGHAVTGTHGTPANNATYGQQAHSGVTGEKKDVMEDNKEKLPGGRDGDHEQTSGTDGRRGHVGTATHGTPATDDAYDQQGHTGVAGMGTHGTGEKDGVMENIKDKIPGGHGDQQQTGGHYGQQGHADTVAHDTPAISGTYRQQGKSGVIGTGTHGAAEKNGEKKDVMEDNKEKLPGGHDGDHEQTSGTDGHRGHVGTATHGTPAIDDAYGQQGHTEVTGMGTHGTGEKNGVMENIKDKLPGGHGDHQQTGGHYGQDGHAGTAAHGTMDTDDTYGQQGHSVLTGTGKHGTDETKGVMEKLPGGHGDHKQTGSTYGKEGRVGTATHGIPATDDAYGQQGRTTVTGTDTNDTGEKKGVIGNVVEKLPGGHSDHQKTGGTYGQQGHTRVNGTGTHGTGEKNGVMENAKEKLPGGHGDHQQTKGSNGQQGHTGVTGMGTDGTGEKKGVMENVTQKLPGGHGNNQQTSGTYGQQGHTDTATHDTGGSYGQQGQPGVTGMGTHGTGEKNGVMENIKEKLPVDIVAPWTPTHGTVDTDDTYGQQGHSGLTGTGTHGTDKTKGLMEKLPGGHGDHQTGSTYGQEGHTGATGAGTHGAGEKKGAMEDIKEKLPGGQEHTTGTTGKVTHDSPATDEKQGHAETTGSGAHDGTGETKSYMEMIKDTLYGTY